MKRIAALGLAGLMLAAAFAPATAEVELTPDDRADLDCMNIMALVGEKDLNAATIGMIYYLGRLEGRSPNIDWPNVFGDYLHDMPREQLQTAGLRCSQELKIRGDALQSVGDRIAKAKP